MDNPVTNNPTPKKKRKFYTSEIVLYSIFGAILLFGFVFAILGVCAYNVGKLSVNPLYNLEKQFATAFHMNGVMDFRLWGTLVMVVAMIAFLIAIYAYSLRASREEAAERRRKERMAILMDFDASKDAATKAPSEEAKKDEVSK